jgi:hypothetical protein
MVSPNEIIAIIANTPTANTITDFAIPSHISFSGLNLFYNTVFHNSPQ